MAGDRLMYQLYLEDAPGMECRCGEMEGRCFTDISYVASAFLLWVLHQSNVAIMSHSTRAHFGLTSPQWFPSTYAN